MTRCNLKDVRTMEKGICTLKIGIQGNLITIFPKYSRYQTSTILLRTMLYNGDMVMQMWFAYLYSHKVLTQQNVSLLHVYIIWDLFGLAYCLDSAHIKSPSDIVSGKKERYMKVHDGWWSFIRTQLRKDPKWKNKKT